MSKDVLVEDLKVDPEKEDRRGCEKGGGDSPSRTPNSVWCKMGKGTQVGRG